MTPQERSEFARLEKSLQKDLELGVANFKVWLFAGLLSNALIIGVPSLFAFVSVQSDASEALTLARDNATRLDGRSEFMTSSQARLNHIESYLAMTRDYKAFDERVEVPR